MEAFVDGKWGAVCARGWSSFWSTPNAQVVCRQLGLGWTAALAFSGSSYPQYVEVPGPGTNGTLPFLMSWVQCNGTEARLQDCGFFNGLMNGLFGTEGCSGQDAGEDAQAFPALIGVHVIPNMLLILFIACYCLHC